MPNYMQRPFISHFTNEMAPQWLVLAAMAVKHLLDHWAGVGFLHMTFDADTHPSMQNSVMETHIWQ